MGMQGQAAEYKWGRTLLSNSFGFQKNYWQMSEPNEINGKLMVIQFSSQLILRQFNYLVE